MNRRRQQGKGRHTDQRATFQGQGTVRAWLKTVVSQGRGAPPRFTVTLGPQGMVSVAVVCLCLMLWAFLSGLWLGQRQMEENREGIKGQQEIQAPPVKQGKAPVQNPTAGKVQKTQPCRRAAERRYCGCNIVVFPKADPEEIRPQSSGKRGLM